ncbi:MAG: PAS domain-containing protein [Chloroflexi bacterium]|nr:PAS domain-containing protein [Chloroflexota bacterium]
MPTRWTESRRAPLTALHRSCLCTASRCSASTKGLSRRIFCPPYAAPRNQAAGRFGFPDAARELDALKREDYLLMTGLDRYPTDAARSLYAEGVRSILSIGLKQEGRLIGALNVHATSEEFFKGDSIEIPLEIAGQLAIAIHTVNLNEQIRRYAADLEDRVEARTNELKREKTRTDAILQSSSDGIVVLDAALRIRQANQAFCDILAATVRLDTEVVYAEIGIARVDQAGEDEHNLVCTIRDVTERRLADARLAESENKYRSLIETLHSGFAVYDLEWIASPTSTISSAKFSVMDGMNLSGGCPRTSSIPLPERELLQSLSGADGWREALTRSSHFGRMGSLLTS